MSTKGKLIWNIYLLILLAYLGGQTVSFFSPKSPVFFYYHILYYFTPLLKINYYIAMNKLILMVVHVIPVILYIYRVRFLDKTIWQALLVLRFCFDILGDSYQRQFLLSFYNAEFKIFTAVLWQLIIIHIPSYYACFMYAFRQDKIFSPENKE